MRKFSIKRTPRKSIFRIIISAVTIMATLFFSNTTALASEDQKQELTELIEQYQDEMKEMLNGMDESTVNETFSFLKEKAADGGLQSEEAIKNAIEEGQEVLGVQVDEVHIEEMLDLVNHLEDMGFDSEKIIESAENMYQEYGADFVDHTEEMIVEAVKQSIGTIIKNAIREFFRMLGESIKNFFTNLF